jgi:hypothetical protein
LPSPESTPPVTNIYFVVFATTTSVKAYLLVRYYLKQKELTRVNV